MAVLSNSGRLVTGRTVLERFAAMSPPSILQPFIDGFQQEHTKYEVAYLAAEKAEERRDDALAAIGQADGKLDLAVEQLAANLVLARKGDRRNPLARYTTHNMSRLLGLAYAKEVEEVEQICAKVAKDEPTEQITAAVAECQLCATGVKTALSALSAPEHDYQCKLAARDELVSEWERAFARLHVHAAAAMDADPQTLKSLFARPERVQQPVTRRAKKKEETPEPPSEPEGTPI
jgi:hypothetical protein